MDLHVLFDTAVEDLPRLEDQVPIVTEKVRRRRARERRTLLAAVCALVIGAGTITVAPPWGRTGTSPSAMPSASARTVAALDDTQYRSHALAVIQSLHPFSGLQLSLDQSAGYNTAQLTGILVTVGGKTTVAGSLRPERWPPVLDGRVTNKCYSTPPPGTPSKNYSCASTTLPDGTLVMIVRWDDNGKLGADIDVWRGLDDLELGLVSDVAHNMTNAELFAFAENPAYLQVHAQAEQLNLYANCVIQGWGG